MLFHVVVVVVVVVDLVCSCYVDTISSLYTQIHDVHYIHNSTTPIHCSCSSCINIVIQINPKMQLIVLCDRAYLLQKT